jgi:lysophospholipase L1-like esterase|tara:strand:- start:519 stop:1607 length:1089 start_codon:yes stop_codon:yes gene_type:complete
MSRIKYSLFILIGWTLGLSIALVSLELFLRMIDLDKWFTAENLGSGGHGILHNSRIEYPISDLYQYSDTKVIYTRNEYGLRDNCVDPSKIKLITIGGSTTDQRYLNFEDTYQYVLQETIENYLNDEYCVSNAGYDGHSSSAHVYLLEEMFPQMIPSLNPEIVLLYVGINDAPIYYLNVFEPPAPFKKELKKLKIVQQLIPLWRFIQSLRTQKYEGFGGHHPASYEVNDYTVSHFNPEIKLLEKLAVTRFRANMKKILTAIDKMNAKAICVTQPHQYITQKGGVDYAVPNVLKEGVSGLDYDFLLRAINTEIISLCGYDNTIDLYAKKFEKAFFYDGVHTTPKGANFIGKQLASEIILRGYVE